MKHPKIKQILLTKSKKSTKFPTERKNMIFKRKKTQEKKKPKILTAKGRQKKERIAKKK